MTSTLRHNRHLSGLRGLARNTLRYWELIRTMVWRDFLARYRGSLGGLFWSVFQPLVMMVIYSIVFSMFLKVKFATGASPLEFPVYLLCGLLPWSAFAEGVTGSTTVIRGNVNLVKRVVFPLEILPVNLALTAAIQQVIGFILLVPLAWWVTGQLHATLLFVPLILGLQLLFAVGVNYFVASLAVYLPDFSQAVGILLTAGMFLTPIFYPEDVVPENMLVLLRLNPMARLVTLYRNAFTDGVLPSLSGFLLILVSCLVVCLAGYFWFMRTKKGFADVL